MAIALVHNHSSRELTEEPQHAGHDTDLDSEGIVLIVLKMLKQEGKWR